MKQIASLNAEMLLSTEAGDYGGRWLVVGGLVVDGGRRWSMVSGRGPVVGFVGSNLILSKNKVGLEHYHHQCHFGKS